MPDNTINTTVTKKYLDYDGLQSLWSKIKETYVKYDNLASELENYEDPFTRKSYVDDQDSELSTRIEQLELSSGQNIDKDTIVNVGGLLQTNLILDIDSENKTLRLVTKDITTEDEIKAKTVISEIDYTPFVRDGLLSNVSVVVIPDDEEVTDKRPAGTYLKFEFNTDAGKESIYLSSEDLGIQTYTGSQYITIDSNNVVSINIVTFDNYLDDYINRNAKITDIITQLQSVQSNISGLDNRLVEIEKSINGYIDENGEAVDGLNTKITKLSETVSTFDSRLVFLEENAAIEPISMDDINNLDNED